MDTGILPVNSKTLHVSTVPVMNATDTPIPTISCKIQ